MNPSETILKKRGHFCSVRITRPVKLKKAFQGLDCQKVTIGVFRAGLNYNNQRTVKDKRESGELPSEPNPLPWGQWSAFPYVIEHKGKRYLRLYPVRRNGKPQVRSFFYLNGKRVNKEDLREMALSSEFSKGSPDCLTVSEANIQRLV